MGGTVALVPTMEVLFVASGVFLRSSLSNVDCLFQFIEPNFCVFTYLQG